MERSAHGFRAERLVLRPSWDGRGLTLEYAVDARSPEALGIRLPCSSPAVESLIVAAAASYLGSLTLAEEVSIEATVSEGLIDELMPITEMLYDIRRWRDSLPLCGPPRIRANSRPIARERLTLVEKRSIALWSGGKDSTFAIVSLRCNGYEAIPLHAVVNSGAEAAERRAVNALAPLLGFDDVDDVVIDHPDFLALSGAYADEWDAFPLSNRVPFGRDLLLGCVATAWALAHGAANVSMGHDRECRVAEVSYRGKRIPRNDIESMRASVILEAAMPR